MKLHSLQISNILSFAYFDNIDDAPKITFDEGLNILIGQNGAGKSTVLEVINFIFKRIIHTQFHRNQVHYERRDSIQEQERRNIIAKRNDQLSSTYTGLRLEPNWNFHDKSQKIKLVIALDDLDLRNIEILRTYASNLSDIARQYSAEGMYVDTQSEINSEITIEITLNKTNKSFSAHFSPEGNVQASQYLANYNFYRELIEIHNLERVNDKIPSLHESFVLIGGYRNYHNFIATASLQSQPVETQIQALETNEYNKSTNSIEQNEPTIFALVRLRLAEIHFNNVGKMEEHELQQHVNDQPFLQKINNKLQLINLKIALLLTEKRSWSYSFTFFDTKRQIPLGDINSLSAGQKAIIHLVFEAYGRGELGGGLVIIDEPEIHLHYQFQHEYLRIIEDINSEQKCQYILVTHSESLINSKTISKVRRFALNDQNYSHVMSPALQEDEKSLIKILDNTRSTYAFFARKIVLVEGDSDRYLFKAIFQTLKPELNQELAILEVGGKGNYPKWKRFFESFGLNVFYIGDFDNVFSLKFNDSTIVAENTRATTQQFLKQKKLDQLSLTEKQEFEALSRTLFANSANYTAPKLSIWKPVIDKFTKFLVVSSAEIVNEIRQSVTDIEMKIEEKYSDKVFILKAGAIEEYIHVKHGDLTGLKSYCDSQLETWLNSNDSKSQEMVRIVNTISDWA